MNLVQAADVADITYRQAQHWARRGYVTGAPIEVGSGNEIPLTARDIARLVTMAELVRHLGMRPDAASHFAEAMILQPSEAVVAGPFRLTREAP